MSTNIPSDISPSSGRWEKSMEEKQNELSAPSGSNLPQELRDEIEKICVEHVDCDIFEVVYLIENLMADQISQAKSQGIAEGKRQMAKELEDIMSNDQRGRAGLWRIEIKKLLEV